ncbi:MAG: ATP-grasp domain-containing protein [Bacteroidales bacterium]|nr:ATP-grasp domain-containing protein [Bacteroidales bacterium]
MIKKILIANRGEIAVRIARTAKEMGISTVTVYAEDDHDSPHIGVADEAYCLGSGNLTDTYLNIQKIIDVTKAAKCDAIHPGYGFLSENAEFARACIDNNVVFIGPSPGVIKLMGNKREANHFVKSLGIPVLEALPVVDNFKKLPESLPPFPLLVKAVAGGGGKGMKIAGSQKELKDALESASREALTAFGNGEVYIEKLVEHARHIEVQLLGDNFGNIIHLFDRECSLQRRYQKVMEEAPSPSLTPELRKKITGAAVQIARAVSYNGAGTIEFLLGNTGDFYFLEMNTRIQVEHPVTEFITGTDIVREQILIASNNKLSFTQEELLIKGHAIEARVYAENPSDNFRPSPGKILYWWHPELTNLRVDTGIKSGYELKYQYDPMIAKIIAYGEDRGKAISKLQNGLSGTVIHGMVSNLTFLQTLTSDNNFLINKISTTYIEENLVRLNTSTRQDTSANDIMFLIAAAIIIKYNKDNSQIVENVNIWQKIGLWRHLMILTVEINKTRHEVEIKQHGKTSFLFYINGQESEISSTILKENLVFFEMDGTKYQFEYSVTTDGEIWLTGMQQTVVVKRKDILSKQVEAATELYNVEHEKTIVSPMHGKILKVLVSENCEITKNDTLLIIDSMKTENRIMAPLSGKIGKVYVKEGDQVKTNMLLAEIQ